MARPRFNRMEPAKQEAILEAASKEFSELGFDGASVNRIIAAAGLSKGAFYYYFDDKADLAATVLQRAYDDILGELKALPLAEDAATFWLEMRAMQRRTLDALRKNRLRTELVRKLGLATRRDPHLASHVEPLIREAYDLASQVWKRGQEVGAVRSDLPVDVLLPVMQSINEALVRRFVPEEGPLDPGALDRVVDVKMDLFRRVAQPGGLQQADEQMNTARGSPAHESHRRRS